MVQIPGNNAGDKWNIIHTTYSKQFQPQFERFMAFHVLAINWHSNSSFESKNLSCINLSSTADLARPHRTESKEAGRHKSYVSEKITVHLQIRANQTGWYHLIHWRYCDILGFPW
jgi:hypothetical protein